MARTIVKQPNGKYAVWSTVVDNFILVGATPEQIVEKYMEDQKERIITQVNQEVEREFMDVNTCFGWIEIYHGEEELSKAKELMNVETYQLN